MHLAWVSPLLAMKRMAWRMAIRVVRGRSVHFWDIPLWPQIHKPNGLWERGRLMGDTRDTRGIRAGLHTVDNFEATGGRLQASAGPHNLTQAYGRRAERRFPVFRRLWKVGKQRWALNGGQDCPPGRAVSASLMQPWVRGVGANFALRFPAN